MEDKPHGLSRFWIELKRRKTDKVIVIYAASAYTILQIEPVLESALTLPSWTSTIVITFLAVGFPVAVIFSWFFDITPGGIEKTKPLRVSERHKMESELKRWRGITLVSLIVIICLLFFNIIKSRIATYEIKKSEKTIAVLNFNHLSPDSLLPFRGDVVASIISTKLRMVPELNVSTSLVSLEHFDKKRSIPETARHFHVFFLVMGDMFRIGNTVRINVNLVRKDGKIIWVNEFKIKDGNPEELDDIPFEIIRQLKITLAPDFRKKLRARATKSPVAYLSFANGTAIQDLATDASDYLTKGDSSFNDLTSTKCFERAIAFYNKAIEEDSTFTVAYVKRAITRAVGFHTEHFLAKDHKEKCREDIEHALRLDSNLLEAKVAFGFYYYYFEKDNERALEFFSDVAKTDPKHWLSKFYMGSVLRAQGHWEESMKLMREVVRSNSLNALFMTNIGISYEYLNKYDSAVIYHNMAIKLMPKWGDAYQNKIESLIGRDGNTIAAEAAQDTAELMVKTTYLNKNRIIFDLYNRKFEDALVKATMAGPDNYFSNGERYMIFAEIHRYLKNKDLSRNYYKSAFDYFSRKLEENPDIPRTISYMGIAAAGLDDKLKAIELGHRAIDLSAASVLDFKERILDLAKIYVMTGEYDECIDLLAELLKGPSPVSSKIIQLDPVWKPLYNMVKFKKLISLYSV